MSELEKKLADEISEEVKSFGKDALIYARGVVDGLKAKSTPKEIKEDE